jgi:two-component system, chemotaxis family, chemotaxis protein CheY
MSGEVKVMIVEDSNTVRYEVRLILNKIGINLVEVANELGMFIKIEEYGKIVDLIIMDLTLQYENGFDLIKKLKGIDKYKNIPVLVLTDHADKDSVVQAKELAVAGYIRKPINRDELVKRVTSILGDTAKDLV